MLNFFKQKDERLVKTKPDVWLTGIQWYIPVAIGVLFVFLLIQFILPVSFDIIKLLLVNTGAAVAVLSFLFKRQFRLFDKNLNPRQLRRIYAINFWFILLLVVVAYAACSIFSIRVQNVIQSKAFFTDLEKLRVAMIKQDDIRIIKEGLPTNTDYLDSLQKNAPLEYEDLFYKLKSIKENKFIKQNIYELDFGYSMFDNKSLKVDSMVTFTDTIAVPAVDTSNAPVADSAIKDTTSFYKSTTPKYVPDDFDWNTPFIDTLRKMTDAQIASNKADAPRILSKYSFKNFTNYSNDTTTNDVNDYFATLNKQVINISENTKFFNIRKNLEIILLINILLSVLCLVLFIFLLKTDMLKKIIFAVTATALTFAVWWSERFLSDIFYEYSISTELFLFAVFVTVFILSGLWKRRQKQVYTTREIVFLFIFNTYTILLLWYLAIAAMLNINWHYENEIEYISFIVILSIVHFTSFVLNYFFMKKYFAICNMPMLK